MSSTRDLEGRVIVVTGAGRGLGRSIAVAAAAAGAEVVIGSRTMDDLEMVAQDVRADGGACVPILLDATDATSIASFVASAVDRCGRIDGLVNNAGGRALNKPTLEVEEEELDFALDLNFRSAFRCSQHVARVMARLDGGSIVNISSIFGHTGTYRWATYGAAKAAVDNLTKSLAVEWASLGIRVNAIDAGIMNTPGYERARRNAPENVTNAIAGIPARRIAEPEEVAALAVFMLTPACYAMTGQVVAVDGGQSSTMPGQLPAPASA